MGDSVNEVPIASTNGTDDNHEGRRGKSTIGCPYLHLEGTVEIAVEVHKLGMYTCDWDQLATATGQSPRGGSFRQKMISARMFGLLVYGEQKIELTELGQRAVDPNSQRGAKVDAFLQVPLFAQAFEQLKGGPLPPHAAIQSRLIDLGVAEKRAEKARQVFLRSARYAGFFEISPNRLAKPGLTESPRQESEGQSDSRSAPDASDSDGNSQKRPPRHPLIEALLDEMEPTGQEWEKSHCATWLRTFLLSISMLYTNREELQQIQISVSHQITQGSSAE